MRNLLFVSLLAICFTSCQENAYDRHSQTDDISHDSATGFQTGAGTENQSIADPNAANTKNTAVPLDSVTVDTTMPEK